MAYHPQAPKWHLTVETKPPKESWWSGADREHFTAECWKQWQRMRGSQFGQISGSLSRGPNETPPIELARSKKLRVQHPRWDNTPFADMTS